LVLANVIKVQPHEVQDFFAAAWFFPQISLIQNLFMLMHLILQEI
jgi:hypothetical protein